MSTPRHFIDYTQYKAFSFCEKYWWERFVKGVQRAPYAPAYGGGKDDPLTLGQLVHAGLQRYREAGNAEPPATLVGELDASAECAAWATRLLRGYVERYPMERFALQRCEAPLRFPLDLPDIEGLAKLDFFFRVDEPTIFDSGLGAFGTQFVLQPGWWIREYKTFAASRERGLWIESWRVNMQADFQMHALSTLIGEPVQGIFIDVLEKPAPYVPKRKCKGACGQQHRLADWIPTGELWACPLCGNQQKLDTSDKSKVERTPQYYRLAVSRTPEQLRRSREEIKRAAERMAELWTASQYSDAVQAGLPERLHPHRSPERCIATTRGVSQECEYFAPHAEGVDASNFGGYVQIEEPLAYAAAESEVVQQ